jgi:hypothetical protein
MREEEGKEEGLDELIRHNNIACTLETFFSEGRFRYLPVRLKGRLQDASPSVP